jgi:glyceraldehyde 3-phosphate dehydrogenase
MLEYSNAPLVSTDIIGSAASCVFDAPLTMVGGRLVKVFGWYDNEWGYANRLVELANLVGRR